MRRASRILSLLLTVGVLSASATALAANSAQQSGAITVSNGDSIQAAIDMCPEGGVVILERGVYSEELAIAKSLTLRSADLPMPTSSAIHDPEEFRYEVWRAYAVIEGSLTIQTGSVSLHGIEVRPGEGATAVDVRAGRASLRTCALGMGLALSDQPALAVRSGAVANLTLCLISYVGGAGVLVEPGGALSADTCYVGTTGGHGVIAEGLVTLRECRMDECGVLAKDGTRKPGLPASFLVGEHVAANGLLLTATGSAYLEGCWITRCRGEGIEADVGVGENVLGALSGINNVIFAGGTLANDVGQVSPYEARLISFYAEKWQQPFDFSWTFGEEDLDLGIALEVAGWAFENEGENFYGAHDAHVMRAYSALQGLVDLEPLVEELLALAEERELDRTETSDFFAAFVAENVDYDYSRARSGTQSPIQTLVWGEGICGDYSVLLSALLKLAGYDAVYVSLAAKSEGDLGHAVVGVALEMSSGAAVVHDGKRYSLVEPQGGTAGSFQLQDWGKWSVIPLLPVPVLQVSLGSPQFIQQPVGDNIARCLVRVSVRNVGADIATDVCSAFDVDWTPGVDASDDERWGDALIGLHPATRAFMLMGQAPLICLGDLQPGEARSFLASGEIPIDAHTIFIAAGARSQDGEANDRADMFLLPPCEW